VYFTASADNSNDAHRIYILESGSADPLGPYAFRGELRNDDNVPSIDPTILRVGGRLYILCVEELGSNATYIARLSNPLTQSGSTHLLVTPDQPWEMGAGSGQSTYPVAEGPEALYHAGSTFVVYSGSDTGDYTYCLGLLSLSAHGNPLDQRSWRKTGPVFQFSKANGVYGPGRASFTVSPDGRQYWMVYHAKDTSAFTYAGRTTRAQPFTWNADGTPHFGVPVRASGS
jgi:GH43 family beta-xylosidase